MESDKSIKTKQPICTISLNPEDAIIVEELREAGFNISQLCRIALRSKHTEVFKNPAERYNTPTNTGE